MANELKLSILSPERKLLDGARVEEATLPGSEGQIQILEGHAPFIGTLEVGIVSYKTPDGVRHSGVVASGFFEVKNDEIVLMCESVEMKGEIDLEAAKRAQVEAETALKQADLDVHAFKRYQLQLERSLIQQQLASKDHDIAH
jgi:F-type H+-transporting ATPase subunit epsilon